MKEIVLIFALASILNVSCQTKTNNNKSMSQNYNKTDEEWKKTLTEEQYYILRKKGTESPFSGKFNLHFEKGKYTCAGCGFELFNSEQKFKSHCGWPSFDGEIGEGNRIKKIKDFSHGMIRTEIVCGQCGGHLGHIFDDGPTKSGLRYCVNSLSIDFVADNDTIKK